MLSSANPLLSPSIFEQAIDQPEEEDWFASYYGEDDKDDLITMDKLLRGYYYERGPYEPPEKVAYELDEWLQLWRIYVEWDRERSTVWRLENSIRTWEELECILENLDIVREEDEALFQEFFNGNFVSCFILEICQVTKELQFSEQKFEKCVKQLALWIQNHKVCEFSSQDFWRVIQNRFNFIGSIEWPIVNEYSRLWRLCCLTPIYISLKDKYQEYVYLNAMENYFNCGEKIEELLDVCDGVIDHGKVKENIVNTFIQERQKELLYRCLKKNFFSTEDAKYGVQAATREKSYELTPMLMMKAHNLWPEIKKE